MDPRSNYYSLFVEFLSELLNFLFLLIFLIARKVEVWFHVEVLVVLI